ncbi:MAG: alpha-L-fucosidase [Rhizomicrobium sp.]|jgi:alpha-L-fucosidase
MTFAPTLESLHTHTVPQWYEDAKFGIFIHWGLFSIPAFASRSGSISDAFRDHYDTAVARTPYTEWYWNAIRVAESESARHHRDVWGDRPYQDFREPFLGGLARWDPAAWADVFRKAGARYVVLVAKHHDGFCLWPSRIGNCHEERWTSPRDIVGELASAVRATGLKFGVYYSGGIDWTFNRAPLRTLADFIGSTPGGDYPAYADAQTRELIERYNPSVLWNDISWPASQTAMLRLFADYYNAIEDGVVNDRWMPASRRTKLLRIGFFRRQLDAKLKAAMKRAGPQRGIVPPEPPHYDFRTPEYTAFDAIVARKWEATRGMSHSFGFNRRDTDADYESADALVHSFIDTVSKNGNLLLNVGPRGEDAQIPAEQLARLKGFGDWLTKNGEGIYGTRPWHRFDAKTDGGLDVRFVQKAEAIYAHILGTPPQHFTIRDGDFPRVTSADMPGDATVIATVTPDPGRGIRVALSKPLAAASAWCLRLN